MLNANGYIDAIKSVRTLAQGSFTVKSIDGQFVVTSTNPHVGLKEAKDFIEDVMALGVQRYLERQVTEQARLQGDILRRRVYVAAPDDIEF